MPSRFMSNTFSKKTFLKNTLRLKFMKYYYLTSFYPSNNNSFPPHNDNRVALQLNGGAHTFERWAPPRGWVLSQSSIWED